MEKVGKKSRSGSRSVLHSVDKVLNSPGGTRPLLDSDLSETEPFTPQKEGMKAKKLGKKRENVQEKMKLVKNMAKETGNKLKRTLSGSSVNSEESQKDQPQEKDNNSPGDLLRKGLKFSSQDSYLRFINMPGKLTKKKRKRTDPPATPDAEGSENFAFNGSVLKENVETPPVPPPRKKKKASEESEKVVPAPDEVDGVHHRFKKSKLKEILSASETRRDTQDSGKKNLIDKAKDKLQASRFRFLNEQLYTQTSQQSLKMFKEDSSLFKAYHQGFQQQATAWPSDPLDVIISACLHLPDSAVVADLGCGEARLARSLNNTVHSFDLVAMAPGVIECDMSRVPLKTASVDVTVFCLSLMGTNIKDFLLEAARILKMGGILKIAELESRFQGEEHMFIRDVEQFGFQLTWKNLNNQYFFYFDFKKVKEPKSRKKLPNIELKACVYKKR